MIIWFTGQPNSGKTTLSLELVHGRRKNVKSAINLAINSDTSNDYTVVALVSPFKDLRELLKNNVKHTVKEIYLHSSRLREGKMVEYYEPPLNNYLDIDTDKYTIEESIKLITHYIQ